MVSKDPFFSLNGYSEKDVRNWFIKQAFLCAKIKVSCLGIDSHLYTYYIILHPAGWEIIATYDNTGASWSSDLAYNSADVNDGLLTGFLYRTIYNQLFVNEQIQEYYYPTVLVTTILPQICDTPYTQNQAGNIRPINMGGSAGGNDPINAVIPWTTYRFRLNSVFNLGTRGRYVRPFAVGRLDPGSLDALFEVNRSYAESAYKANVSLPRPDYGYFSDAINAAQEAENKHTINEIIEQLQRGVLYQNLREIYDPQLLDEAYSEYNRIKSDENRDFIPWTAIPDIMMTQGIDNLGVFTPFFAKGDQFATYYLYKGGAMDGEVQRNFLVGDLQLERLPAYEFAMVYVPADFAAQMAVLGVAASMVPITGGQAAASIRLSCAAFQFEVAKEMFRVHTTATILPRMYGFGQHNVNGNQVASYETYLEFIALKCPEKDGIPFLRTGRTFEWNDASGAKTYEEGWNIIPMSEDKYNEFVKAIQDTMEIYDNEF